MANQTLTDTEKKQKNYYDSIADVYDEHYANADALTYRHNQYEKFLKGFDLRNKKVLDAMCGGGQNTGFFLKHGAIVTGVDISSNQCEKYKKRFPGSQVYCSSILNNNFRNNEFDFIVTDSIHHLHPNVKECVAEFNRILKQGGLLMFWEPSAKSVFDYFRKLWYRKDKTYFEANEAAIDLKKLEKDNTGKFQLIKKKYGGNLAYLLVNLSMGFRIPAKYVKYYSAPLMLVENVFSIIQSRYTALWFLALFKKQA